MSDTSARGRLAFGCALQRSLDQADKVTRYYAGMAARFLFIAALEAKPGYVDAARLWDADDAWDLGDLTPDRSELLKICSAAGFDDRAGLTELRLFACRLNADLIRERPSIASFGPESTKQKSGDPRHTDVSFIHAAFFLLSMKENSDWLLGGSVVGALSDGDESAYQRALSYLATQCGTA